MVSLLFGFGFVFECSTLMLVKAEQVEGGVRAAP